MRGRVARRLHPLVGTLFPLCRKDIIMLKQGMKFGREPTTAHAPTKSHISQCGEP